MKITLNPKQQQAVEFIGNPLLIIAGAGSGKTSVITHKISYLINQNLAQPENILAITFTNKAANEMKARVAKMAGYHKTQPFISTFHTFCVYILRKEFHNLGRGNHFTIYDEYDQKQALKIIFKSLNIDEENINLQKVMSIISILKTELIDVEEYIKNQHRYFYEKEISKIYKTYQEYLLQNNAIDFDDMLFYTVKLFQTCPEVLKTYQNRFQYILLDEFQDTNVSQYEIAKLLAANHHNICAVGDFDQNIYSWRGANIKNILNFEKAFPNTKTVYLEQNYRSTQSILNAANGLISHNLHRKEKNLWTKNSEGESLCYYHAFDAKDEAKFIASEISQIAKQTRLNLNEFAILYRTNAQSRVIEDVFNKYKISYRVIGGLSFYSRKEIKDIIAYLRLIYNPDDNSALIRIINEPKRGIGSTAQEKLQNKTREQNQSIYSLLKDKKLPLSKEQNHTIENFFTLINSFNALYEKTAEHKLPILIKGIIEQSGYATALKKENTLESLERLENIKELISVAEEENLTLAEFLNQISLLSDLDDTITDTHSVTLMTLHNAKGLEFNYVFIAGLEEGLLPHYKSQFDQSAIEEERRLCYVGITRGKKNVYLSSANKRIIFGETWYNEISRFIKELPGNSFACFVSDQLVESEDWVLKKFSDWGLHYEVSQMLPEKKSMVKNQNIIFKKGDMIMHQVWGKGEIIDIEGDGPNSMLHISFPEETKKIMLKYAPLTKV